MEGQTSMYIIDLKTLNFWWFKQIRALLKSKQKLWKIIIDISLQQDYGKDFWYKLRKKCISYMQSIHLLAQNDSKEIY